MQIKITHNPKKLLHFIIVYTIILYKLVKLNKFNVSILPSRNKMAALKGNRSIH